MSKASEFFDDVGELEDLIEDARMSAETDWEDRFVKDIKSRQERYGLEMFLTETQLEKLENIADKGKLCGSKT